MPKIVGTRERVHQPFYDSLIRVDGSTDLRTTMTGVFGVPQPRTQLFLRAGGDIAITNLTNAGTFPSDQTFITLAVRVWTYFRFNPEAQPNGTTASVGATPGVTGDRVMRVHKLYHQAENQLFWQFQAGDKPQLTTFTAYTPMAGGLDGFSSDSRLPRFNNGVPTSSALMRLARPILIPPRQGFQCVVTASPIGPSTGADIIAQLAGSVDQTIGPAAVLTNATGFPVAGHLSVPGQDNIEKDVKYLIDGVHSRDVL
jgi:hypothetical protein